MNWKRILNALHGGVALTIAVTAAVLTVVAGGALLVSFIVNNPALAAVIVLVVIGFAFIADRIDADGE